MLIMRNMSSWRVLRSPLPLPCIRPSCRWPRKLRILTLTGATGMLRARRLGWLSWTTKRRLRRFLQSRLVAVARIRVKRHVELEMVM
ncbi:hypothetical protein HanPI659440_Chr16g0625761 [Helianthus annuus]|nr:hypothetical protein HanPI659440_Chr16g0625761 [Helianthus annuus]